MQEEKKFPKVTLEQIQAKIKHTEVIKHVSVTGQILRWAVITMENGFAVTGRPSCARCPENDEPECGKQVAIDNAMDEIWQLEGYLLAEQMRTIRTGGTIADEQAVIGSTVIG